MWPTFRLACLLVFVASSVTFQVSGNRFFGVVSRVISELRWTARWRECRRQLRYFYIYIYIYIYIYTARELQ
jgi:hypothetical protein